MSVHEPSSATKLLIQTPVHTDTECTSVQRDNNGVSSSQCSRVPLQIVVWVEELDVNASGHFHITQEHFRAFLEPLLTVLDSLCVEHKWHACLRANKSICTIVMEKRCCGALQADVAIVLWKVMDISNARFQIEPENNKFGRGKILLFGY